MKAISLMQPWAQLVAADLKSIETRSWSTSYRGQLAIHASKTFPSNARRLCYESVADREVLVEDDPVMLVGGNLLSLLPSMDEKSLPLGAIVGVATVYDCCPVERVRDTITNQERQFGDYSDGRWAWLLHEQRMLEHPIVCRGALGIWNVPERVVEFVDVQVATAS